MTVSVIIPTFNEEDYLPHLLESLYIQNVKYNEVIIADGNSTDKTISIAKEYKCLTCEGVGHPSIGRNNGAKLATGDLLLFIDADTILPKNVLERFITEMETNDLQCAIPVYTPYDGNIFIKMLFSLSNKLMFLVRKKIQYGAGYFIAIKKDVFDLLTGFDETLYLGEDHDLISRANKKCKYDILQYRILISARRYRTNGFLSTINLYTQATIAHIFKKKVTKKLPNYLFGNHVKKKES
jgi:glycosyltransferase involved in cell wall biosynthesis